MNIRHSAVGRLAGEEADRHLVHRGGLLDRQPGRLGELRVLERDRDRDELGAAADADDLARLGAALVLRLDGLDPPLPPASSSTPSGNFRPMPGKIPFARWRSSNSARLRPAETSIRAAVIGESPCEPVAEAEAADLDDLVRAARDRLAVAGASSKMTRRSSWTARA
jgi:hypothetical protein